MDISKTAVELRNISYTYEEGTHALKDISLKIFHGEFVAFLASNGSGKTTLIKSIVGLIKPQEGVVMIDGDDIASLDSKSLYQKLGVVFQNPEDQLFAPTVSEDVAFGPRNMGLDESEVRERTDESLKSVGAFKLRDKAIHHLSFGEKKRVTLAGALAMRPSVLILDEPTAGLDPAGEAAMMRLLSNLNREHDVTVVIATHSIDMLPLFADRVFVFEDGVMLKSGAMQDIFLDHEMIKRAGLRLPYVSHLLHELKLHDGVPINGLPLTIGEARKRILELIPDEILEKRFEEKPS